MNYSLFHKHSFVLQHYIYVKTIGHVDISNFETPNMWITYKISLSHLQWRKQEYAL